MSLTSLSINTEKQADGEGWENRPSVIKLKRCKKCNGEAWIMPEGEIDIIDKKPTITSWYKCSKCGELLKIVNRFEVRKHPILLDELQFKMLDVN